MFRPIHDSVLMGATELKTFTNVYMCVLCSFERLFRLFRQGLQRIINNIEDDNALELELKQIARTHIRKGVTKAHIDVKVKNKYDFSC